jgi:3D-(3,5/4)-trihydroxycyclohexane-1,2-dione acylhydrolase (decyclizing)
MIRAAKKPMIIAGGGVIYSEATATLRDLVDANGHPRGRDDGGQGQPALRQPALSGRGGRTGTLAANIVAKEADLVIGIGTRYSDFTTASKDRVPATRTCASSTSTSAEFDAYKHSAMAVVGDAKVTLTELAELLAGYSNSDEPIAPRPRRLHDAWETEVDRIYAIKTAEAGCPEPGRADRRGERAGRPGGGDGGRGGQPARRSAQALAHAPPQAVPHGVRLQCMGYEIAGGLGVKMAAPAREVYVMVGDGSWLMMNADITTAVQEGFKLTIVLMGTTRASRASARSADRWGWMALARASSSPQGRCARWRRGRGCGESRLQIDSRHECAQSGRATSSSV